MKKLLCQYSVGMLLCLLSLTSYASATDACENVTEVKENVTTSTCFQYVKGFLDGALLSDAQIMKNLDQDKDMSGFFDRAFKTRVGKTRGDIPDTFLADFCLPESTASDEVVLTILSALKKIKVKNDITAEMIFENVKREFPFARSV